MIKFFPKLTRYFIIKYHYHHILIGVAKQASSSEVHTHRSHSSNDHLIFVKWMEKKFWLFNLKKQGPLFLIQFSAIISCSLVLSDILSSFCVSVFMLLKGDIHHSNSHGNPEDVSWWCAMLTMNLVPWMLKYLLLHIMNNIQGHCQNFSKPMN